MNFNSWRVSVERPIWGAGINLYFWRSTGEGEVQILTWDGESQIILNHKAGTPIDGIKPTLFINSESQQEILKALADALDAEGVKTDNDHKLIGTLDATRYHLEDLRKLMKLPESTGHK